MTIEQTIKSNIWFEKYRPKKLENFAMTSDFKAKFSEIIENKQLPNLILYGPAGTGKTSLAQLLCKELGYTMKQINASLETSINDIRNKVKNFVTTVSFEQTSTFKVVFLDEVDGLSPEGQNSLKGLIEETHQVARYIFTTNNINSVIEPLQSRCRKYEFGVNNNELKKEYVHYLNKILKSENIKCDNIVILAKLVDSLFPDLRSLVQIIEDYSLTHKVIDNDILENIMNDIKFQQLVEAIQSQSFDKMSKVVRNITDPSSFYSTFYKKINSVIQNDYDKMQVALVLAQFNHTHSICVDKQINLLGCLISISEIIKPKNV